MKAIGCLLVIILVAVGIFLLSSGGDMTGEEKARFIGEKAHRGWNRLRQFAGEAREGWKSADQKDPIHQADDQ